jgi:hypothetical protein
MSRDRIRSWRTWDLRLLVDHEAVQQQVPSTLTRIVGHSRRRASSARRQALWPTEAQARRSPHGQLPALEGPAGRRIVDRARLAGDLVAHVPDEMARGGEARSEKMLHYIDRIDAGGVEH